LGCCQTYFTVFKRYVLFWLRLTRGSSLSLHGFTDMDWVGSIDDRKSTGGYIVFLGTTPISWKSGKQRTIVRSSTEVEYKALVDGTAKVLWLRYLLLVYASLPVMLPPFGVTTWVLRICLLI